MEERVITKTNWWPLVLIAVILGTIVLPMGLELSETGEHLKTFRKIADDADKRNQKLLKMNDELRNENAQLKAERRLSKY